MCGIIGYVGDGARSRCCSQGCGASSTAATTRPASRCARTTASTTSAPSATSRTSSTRRARTDPSSRHGLGHTRWATHGGVTEQNAHPLTGCDAAKIAIVLNGIVENYRELKDELLAEGHTFTSETDAEVVAHLLERELRRRPRRRRSRASTRGSRATSRSSPSTTTSRTCSSASATRRRSSSASARARTSSPRTSPRS